MGEENPNRWAGWGHIGGLGGLCLAAYLILVGVSALIGGTAIPAWVAACFAVAAGVLILIGR